VKNTELSVLWVEMSGQPVLKYDLKYQEYLEFKGSENALVYENTYEMKLACHLYLRYYPFDVQRCFLNVIHTRELFLF